MMRRYERLQSVCAALLLASGLCVAGCDKPEPGPKRADHVAAHRPRFHPSIQRDNDTGATAATAPSSQPGEDAFPVGIGPIGRPVLFVNGQALTVPEILEPIVDELRVKSEKLSLEDYVAAVRQAATRQVQQEIATIIVWQEADRHYSDQHKEAFDKKAEELVRNRINDRYGGVRARYEERLRALGLTSEQMKEQAKREIMRANYLHERFQPLLQQPSRTGLWKYYQQHLEEFTTAPKAEMFLIEIPLEKELGKALQQATAEEISAARERASKRLKEAKRKLDAGESFAAVAEAYSKGINVHKGGAWGEISPGSLVNRWAKPAEVVFTLEPGQISEVIETDQNVFIVKCGRSTPLKRVSFEEAQEAIIQKLIEEQYNELSREYIGKLIERATVDKQEQFEFLRAVVASCPRPPGYEPPPASQPTTRP